MTWHLKDRELEKVFEDYSGRKFVKALNYAIEQENIDSECIVYVEFGREFLGGDFVENCLCFRTDEVEDVPEYNPNAWNEYPKITPPQNKPLRVEFADKSGTKAFFDDCLREYITAKKINAPCRFRPWVDRNEG